jgi:hypothetical protein
MVEARRMVIFGTTSHIIFDINLIVQLMLLLLLVVGGYVMRVKLVRRNHGFIMAIATITNIMMLLSVMLPSLVLNLNAIVSEPTSPGVVMTLGHVVLGLIAISGGALFSARFIVSERPKTVPRCGKRREMRAIFLLWIFTLLLGIGFYWYYYLPR